MNQHWHRAPKSGGLFLICGPSGVGKDSLMAEAMQRFEGNPYWRQVRRYITRPADAGGEDHIAVTADEFLAMRAQGQFGLHWQAHGLHYGIHQHDLDLLAEGVNLLVNVSRAVIDSARQAYAQRRIIYVTARTGVLQQRLAQRGRESNADQLARLARANAFMPLGQDVWVIDNSASLVDGVNAFMACLMVPIRSQG